MRPAVPTIVTHPCTLVRDGLRQILGSTPFRPIHLAAELNQAAVSALVSAEVSLWLLGIEKCSVSTFDLVRRKSGPSKAWLKIKNPKAPAATRVIDGTF